MRSKDRAKPSWLRNAWLWGVCALCLWLAAEQGWQTWTARHASPAVEATAPLSPASSPATTPASAPAISPASTPASAPATHSSSGDADRIAELEEELAEARKPTAFKWQTTLLKWWEDTGVGFGWAIVYFSLIPAWLNGQSLGKKLLGLRVVELTGKPLTVRTCFSRYGGYAAGMATGMFGFAQILWDANRQSIQDKVAHTVVLDLRAPYQATKAPEAPAAPVAPVAPPEALEKPVMNQISLRPNQNMPE